MQTTLINAFAVRIPPFQVLQFPRQHRNNASYYLTSLIFINSCTYNNYQPSTLTKEGTKNIVRQPTEDTNPM